MNPALPSTSPGLRSGSRLTAAACSIKPFDPFPFTLLTTVVSLEAIFLTLFVLASENRLTRETERRGQLDLQVNLLAEQEMTMVLRMLKEICEHLDLRGTITSEKFRELAARTDVSQLAAQLEQNEYEQERSIVNATAKLDG